jgi:hypothetical protein
MRWPFSQLTRNSVQSGERRSVWLREKLRWPLRRRGRTPPEKRAGAPSLRQARMRTPAFLSAQSKDDCGKNGGRFQNAAYIRRTPGDIKSLLHGDIQTGIIKHFRGTFEHVGKCQSGKQRHSSSVTKRQIVISMIRLQLREISCQPGCLGSLLVAKLRCPSKSRFQRCFGTWDVVPGALPPGLT